MKWESNYIAKLLGGFEVAHVILLLAVITKYSQNGLTNRINIPHIFGVWEFQDQSTFFLTYFPAPGLSCGTRDIHCAVLASVAAACRLSLIVARGLQSMRASVVGAHRLSCSEACEILVLRPGIKPSSPALQAGLLTSGPSRKSLADSALDQVPFLGLWTAAFVLCHHLAKREGEPALVCLLITNPIIGASLVAQLLKNLPAMRETWV